VASSDDDEPENPWDASRAASASTLADAPEKRCPSCGRGYPRVAEVCANDGAGLVAVRRTSSDCFIGRTINDRYAIESVLGSGGMGTVYEAIHTGLHKHFALKILRPDIAFDKVTVERFIQEARIAASLKHPNLIDVSDFGEVSADDVPEVAGRRVPFFVMELLRGDTLLNLVRDRGPLDSALVAEIMLQTASALVVAHTAGVIHRDLKPDNIFIVNAPKATSRPRRTSRTRAVVLDFGIAKVAASAVKLTRPNFVFGTPAYMSPEQKKGAGLDARADLYSLGVVMYEALTARAPSEGIAHFDPDDPHLWELRPVVMRCLETDPNARFQSASEIVVALGGTAPIPSEPPPAV